jgi:hypothetical protein
MKYLMFYTLPKKYIRCHKADVHKIPARVQCTVQVCELTVSNLHPPPPPPYRSRQIICLSHSESVRLPLQMLMRPSPHQLHAGPFHPVHACMNSSTHRTLCAVHGLCTSAIRASPIYACAFRASDALITSTGPHPLYSQPVIGSANGEPSC